jgi:hypothetical protein
VTAPIIGIERVFLEKLGDLLRTLPAGKAELSIGPDATSHDAPLCPMFQITPANPRAARIRGFVCDGQGIDFTIGVATGGEVFIGRNDPRADLKIERFLALLRAVFTSSFVETVTYDRKGRPIRGRIRDLGGHHVLGAGSIVLWPIRLGKSRKRIAYAPY